MIWTALPRICLAVAALFIAAPKAQAEGVFELENLTPLACPKDSQDFTRTNCFALRHAESYADFEGYFARCSNVNTTPFKTPLAFLEHGRCKALLDIGDEPPRYTAAEIVIVETKNYMFFDFYRDLIQSKAKASENNGYDQLKEVVAMFNTPNASGQSLLDFMEYYWHEELSEEFIPIETQMKRLHNVGCMIGAVYYQHPELNADCLSRQKSKYID